MQTAERTRFTEAEMATVRDTDLPDLLSSLGYQVKRIGRYYTTQEMDSIRIKDRRTWFRYSEGIGGDAITFLQRFYNKSFPEAVEYLLTWHGRARDSPSVSTPRQTKEKEEKVPFTLPPANVDHRRVFAYLRKRGIAPQVIRGFVEAGLLYEDAQHHNCVFVGRDQSGAPVFANQRGTYDWNSSSFKGDVPGSNKDSFSHSDGSPYRHTPLAACRSSTGSSAQRGCRTLCRESVRRSGVSPCFHWPGGPALSVFAEPSPRCHAE